MPHNAPPVRRVLPSWLGRRHVVVLGAAIAVASAVAYAAPLWPYVSPTYKAGDPLSSTTLNGQFKQVGENLNDLDARFKMLQAQVAALQGASLDCLPGYTADVANGVTTCTKGADVMVKVGTGPEAFWVDKFEASVWDKPEATGTQYGKTATGGNPPNDDYPGSFPDNGQRGPSFVPLYAVSKAGVMPSASLTWFQAQEACRSSGKRLPLRHEWLAAASGTNDPGENSGTGGACVTKAPGPRMTGEGLTCVSAWGAQDMVGNLWEWTDEWYAAPGWIGGSEQQAFLATLQWTPSEYNGDGLFNIASTAQSQGMQFKGHPAAALRGACHQNGTLAGVFALSMADAPSGSTYSIGLRCVARGR